MRDVAHIWDAWQTTDPHVGNYKAHTIVTVEKDFWLRLGFTEGGGGGAGGGRRAGTQGSNLGQWKRGPARWFQRADGSQEETRVPNVRRVAIDRSIDTDAGTCEIVLANSKMLGLGEPQETEGQLGRTGYYTWARGKTQESKARWGHAPNEWSEVLVPNALLRTYQGYGGHDKTLEGCLTDGNLVLTGVWLVDEVMADTGGSLTLRCRDMGKLLLDQSLYTPLIPESLYPLKYQRYTFENYEIPPEPKPKANRQSVVLPAIYEDGAEFTVTSSSDEAAAEQNAAVHGHRPSDIFDWSFNDPPNAGPGEILHQDTYWLSEDHGDPAEAAYIEMRTEGRDFNLLYLHAWAGNYKLYVSVLENGNWVTDEGSGQGGFAQGIPYVVSSGVPFEDLLLLQMPRTYRASKIRLTFTNLQNSQQGGYRAGIRKVIPLYDSALAEYPPYCLAGCSYPKIPGENHAGYWQTRHNGKVYAFGDARVYQPHASNPVKKHTNALIAINCTEDGTGYWTLDTHGRIIAYGSAQHYGDSYDQGRADIVDFAPSPTGAGYWILHADGTVDDHGDAAAEGNAAPTGTLPTGVSVTARRIESHPTDSGYWVLWTDGTVEAFGLTHHGDANRTGFTDEEYVAVLRRTSTGDGYWIVSGGGIVQQFGDAFNFGSGVRYDIDRWAAGLCWDMLVSNDVNGGYGIQHADGAIDSGIGDFQYFGSIAEGSGQLRKDGNYKDYADIVKELLLWSGFYLYRDPQPASMPDVYGNIETTGAYSNEPLPQEIFDKVPVMQAINELKEIVGYVFWIDDEGGVRFESPNWWALGNYDYEGAPIDFMPEIDERVQLTDYRASFKASDARSEITISSVDPKAGYDDAVTTTIIPQGAEDLRGMVVPAMWFNGAFTSKAEQQVMAHLVAMHTWFARRTGDVTCTANPLIGVNDQVRLYERQSGETNIHYVRGVSTTHDIEAGEYTMTLTTHWLGGSPWLENPLFLACTMHPDDSGYWQVNSFGEIFAFGSAELMEKNIVDSHLEDVISIRSTPTGDGLWTLDTTGKVLSYGEAEHFGDLSRVYEKDAADFAIAPDGLGYLILLRDGTVHEFGSAVNHGDATPTGLLQTGVAVTSEAIEHHPTAGYWILNSDGTVEEFGGATNYGNADRVGYDFSEYTSVLRRTPSGNGYFIVSGGGIVHIFGDAVGQGNALRYNVNVWVYGLCWDMLVDSTGEYAVQHADGRMDATNLFPFVGAAGDSEPVAGIDWVMMPRPNGSIVGDGSGEKLYVAPEVIEFLSRTGSKAASAVNASFKSTSPTTSKAL